MSEDPMRGRLLVQPHKFETLEGKDDAARLTRILAELYRSINEDRFIDTMPPVTGLVASGKVKGVLLTWTKLDKIYAPSVWGARVWRVLASDDGNKAFFENAKKRVLVDLVMTTAWHDATGNTSSYIYWVQWVDRLERVGLPSGAATAAGS